METRAKRWHDTLIVAKRSKVTKHIICGQEIQNHKTHQVNDAKHFQMVSDRSMIRLANNSMVPVLNETQCNVFFVLS